MLISGPVSFYHLKKNDKNIFLFGDMHQSLDLMKLNVIRFDEFLKKICKTGKKYDLHIEIHKKILDKYQNHDMLHITHSSLGRLNYNVDEGYYDCKYKNINYYGCFMRNNNWLLFTKNYELKELNDATYETMNDVLKCKQNNMISPYTANILLVINASKIVYNKLYKFFKKYGINNYDDLVNFYMNIYFNKNITDETLLQIARSNMLNNSSRSIVNNLIIKTNDNCYNFTTLDEIIMAINRLQIIILDTDNMIKMLRSENDVIAYYGDLHIRELYDMLLKSEYECEYKYDMNFLRKNNNIRTIDVGNCFDKFL